MPLRCDEIAAALPAVLDRIEPAPPAVVAHVETCLSCQLELARYRRLLRLLGQLRGDRPPVPAGLVGATILSIEAAATRRAVRSVLTGRPFAYAAGVLAAGVGALVALALRGRATRTARAARS